MHSNDFARFPTISSTKLNMRNTLFSYGQLFCKSVSHVHSIYFLNFSHATSFHACYDINRCIKHAINIRITKFSMRTLMRTIFMDNSGVAYCWQKYRYRVNHRMTT